MRQVDYWSVVEPIWEAISIYNGPKVFLSQYSEAPQTARLLITAHWCQSDVRNGGFRQFFENSTGVLAPEAIEAFYEIGMPRAASIVKEACALFDPDYPRAKSTRAKIIREKGLKDELDRLEDSFYSAIESEAGGFTAAADAYASANNS